MRVILDRYELVTPIASGGMGTLWVAVRPANPALVSMKGECE
jgi:hypothetical protein